MASLPFRSRSPKPKLKNPFGPDNDLTAEKSTAEEGTKKDGPRLSFAPPPMDRKRSSVQFSLPDIKPPGRAESEAVPATAPKLVRRASSPPPQRTYERGVSFDTFDNRDATDYVFTLNYKHKNYQHTRRSRTFLCGTDQKDYSEFALEWLIDELVDDGDEIVCLRVVEKDSKLASESNGDRTKYQAEAQKLLEQVIAKNAHDEKAVSVVLELAVGKVQDIIQRMIQIYEPAVLIVGTRGRSLNGMQGLLPGSVSKYCLQQSPVPVIVVRPTTKRLKKKKKRLADPTRRDYNQILSMSEAGGGHVLDKPVRESMAQPLPAATDQEAAAVARAIGLPQSQIRQGYHPARSTSSKNEPVSDAESPSPTGPLSPEEDEETNERVLKSPKLKPQVSPSPSPSPVEEDEEDIVDKFSRTKRTTTAQAGKAVGAVVDEVVPEKAKRRSKSPLPSPVVHDPNDAGQNILDMLDELTG